MLLTIADVASVLNVSVSTVKRLVASSAIASVQVGASRRVQPSDLASFIASSTTPAASASGDQGH